MTINLKETVNCKKCGKNEWREKTKKGFCFECYIKILERIIDDKTKVTDALWDTISMITGGTRP